MTAIMEYRVKDRAKIQQRIRELYKQRQASIRAGLGEIHTLELERLERIVRDL